MVVHACDPSYMGGHTKKDYNLRMSSGKNARPYMKKKGKKD
jgi:hypothetical protein